MNDPLLWQLLLQILLIMLNAVFACAEIAVLSVNENKLAQLTEEGNKRAVRLSRLTSQPARFLATIQVAITLSGFLGSAFAADNFANRLSGWLVNDLHVPISENTIRTVSVILITLILSYFTLIFGELVPKRVAMKKADRLALGMSAMITFISKLFAPIVALLTASTNLVLRILGIDPNAEEDEISEEEIKLLVDRGTEKGILTDDEQEIIQNVFEFDDLPVGEFATHRTEVDLLWIDDSPEQWETVINETRHSIYPVCGETADEVVGILDAKDFFRLRDRTKEALHRLVRPAFFVPETVKADLLVRQMKKSRNQFAVVLDEYGGMVGIVTIYDLVEQLLGDIEPDEPGEEQLPEIQKNADGTWNIRGSATMDDVAQELGIKLPVEDYETFGGYVFGLYGQVPDDGTTFSLTAEPLLIDVLSIQDHKLEMARVTVEEKQDEEEEKEDGQD